MAVECAINVGFYSNFSRFRQSGHSKTPLRLAIINEFRSTQPTAPKKLSQTQPDLLFCQAENLDAFPLNRRVFMLDNTDKVCYDRLVKCLNRVNCLT